MLGVAGLEHILSELATARGSEEERRRVVRIWNTLQDGDLFFKISEWPLWAQRLALTRHRDYKQRYQYFFFLAGNGLKPEIAADWTLTYDYRQGKPTFTGYDEAAIKHARSMITQVKIGDMFKGTRPCVDLATSNERGIPRIVKM